MKTLFGLLFICATLSVAFVQCCKRDSDCAKNECCIEWLPYYKSCSDMPDDVGDRCGGQFLCACQNGLKCVPDERPGLYGRLKLGTGSCE